MMHANTHHMIHDKLFMEAISDVMIKQPNVMTLQHQAKPIEKWQIARYKMQKAKALTANLMQSTLLKFNVLKHRETGNSNAINRIFSHLLE